MNADPIARALAVRVRRNAQKSANTLALIRAVRTNGYFVRPPTMLAAGDMPTVTLGANGANSTINAAAPRSATVPRGDPRLTYLSGVPMLAGTVYPREAYFTSRGAYYGAGDAGGTPVRATGFFAYEFVHTGNAFEIPVYGAMGGSGVNLRVLVNGALGGTASVPNATGGLYFLRVAFTETRARTIRIETWGIPCNGVHVASGSEISSTGRSYPLVTVIGDSFMEGSGAEIGDITSTVIAREAAWSRAAENVWFIDRLQQPRREGIYSTLTDQAALYTGGVAGTDSTHPTPAGHRHDGLLDAAQLRRLILTEFA